jgi:4-amino-4-deoxy-L-arabinose transferase-like glycosyltransferase
VTLTSEDRSAWRGLVAAVLVTAGARLSVIAVALLTHPDGGSFETPDTARYLALAEALVSGRGFTIDGAPEIYRLPGFPALLAIGTWFGAPVAVTLTLHLALGVLTTWLCYYAGRLHGGPAAGACAAMLYALDPGQWAWGATLLSEPLFTALVAGAYALALRYTRHGDSLSLLAATVLASLSAYVRIIGYLLPVMVVVAAVVARRRREPTAAVMGTAVAALIVAVSMLGAWHVRNAVRTGYAGFSLQGERALYITGGTAVDERASRADGDPGAPLRRDVEQLRANRGDADGAAEMRRRGLARVLDRPVPVVASYAAGVAVVLVHPGAGALLRHTGAITDDRHPSASQQLVLRRWRGALTILHGKGLPYWLLTAPLAAWTLICLALALAGLWRARAMPGGIVALAMLGYLLALSGGVDADSRRRAPLVPIACVMAAPVLMGRWRVRRSSTG